MTKRRRLTPSERLHIISRYRAGDTVARIARLTNRSVQTIGKVLDEAGVERRCRRAGTGGRKSSVAALPKPPKRKRGDPVYIPTPEQIAETCAAIRAQWSEREEHQRRAVPDVGAWTPPKVREVV